MFVRPGVEFKPVERHAAPGLADGDLCEVRPHHAAEHVVGHAKVFWRLHGAQETGGGVRHGGGYC
jgi:hypothetical protein